MVKKLLALLLFTPLQALAAITFVGHGTADTVGGSNTATPTINASSATNDALILFSFVSGDAAGEAHTTPTDWTLLESVTNNGASESLTLDIYCKIHDGSEANPALVTTGTGTGDTNGGRVLTFRGTNLDCAQLVAHTAEVGTAAATALAHPALTVSTNNTVVAAYGVKRACELCVWDTLATSGLSWVEDYDSGGTVGDDWSATINYVIETSAANVASGSWTATSGDESQITAAIILSLKEVSGAAPAFSAGPAGGTATQTTLPITFTTDQTGTVEGVACANGAGTPSVAEVFADQCAGGGAALAHFDEAVVSGVSDGHTFTGLTAGTTYDTWHAIDGNTTDSTVATALADLVTVAAPTFTAGPTAGSITSTTIPVTFTSDQTANVFGVACPDGQAVPTVTQVLAGNCTGDIAAVDAFTQAVVATVSDGDTFTPLVASTTYDTHYAQSNAAGNSAAISTLANQTTTGATAPAFTVGPTETPATNGFTIAGTITCVGTCTVEAVACAPGDAVPTNAELEAGQCGGGNAALINAQENWTTGVGNDFLLTAANKPPRLDVYVAGTDGTLDTVVTSLTDQDRSPDAGQEIACLSSLSPTSIFDCATCVNGGSADTYFTPDVAVNDCFEHDAFTNEAGACAVDFAADGDFLISGTCTGARSFDLSYEDVSSATNALFTAPAVGNFTTDDRVYFANAAPVCDNDEIGLVVLTEDVVMTSIDLDTDCSDADGDALTYAVTSGTLPPGMTLTGATGVLAGTPNTENEAGVSIIFTVTDIAGDTDTVGKIFYIVNTWTVPDCVTNDASECADEIVLAAPWRVDNIGLTVTAQACSLQPIGDILTQNPTAAAEATHSQSILVTISKHTGTIPDTTGMTEAQAAAAIAALCP